MTAPFDAFTDALEALCIKHGIRITCSRDYDDYSVYLELATEQEPAGCDISFVECIPPTPEELAEQARREKEEAERQALSEARYEELMRQRAEWMASPEFAAQSAENQRQANLSRESSMRVTRIPGDFYDIGERPCRVYCNEQEIEGWTVADDFRRVVETPGKVHHGAVRIDMAPEVPELAPSYPAFETVEVPATIPEDGSHMEIVDYSYTATVAVPTIEPHRSVLDEAQRVWVGGELVVDKTASPAKPKHIPARKRKAGK